MLTAHRLSCLRNGQCLFSGLEFSLLPAEILHITGSNGSGKSTLLNLLIGLRLPQEGEICWQGTPITQQMGHYRAQLTYLGHKIGIKNNLTVLENLTMAAKLAANPTAQRDYGTVLNQFNLQYLTHTLGYQLSAGQRQRVALSRLMLTTAPLWILDEPFTSLDQEMSVILQALLFEHCRQGGMVILTTHHPLNWEGVHLKRLAL